ncbi:MAG: PIG-L deacetylase family protein [Bacillota bacterium]
MSQKTLHTLRGVLLIVITVLLLVAVYRYFFPSAPRVQLPEEMPLTRYDRILVIAPHCDDETLGAGGLIARALSEGAQVRVVIITNGDGFTFAAAGEGHTLLPTRSDYLRLAYQRQQESGAALNYLGLPAANLTFLGYPDRGLASMWGANWNSSTPYWSRSTQSDRTPYLNSYSPEAVYSGQSLVADLGRFLLDFQPTILVLPHPNDAHSDHWATFNFVTFTLQELRSQKQAFAQTIREYGYLVHRGDWPAPKGLLPARELLPPPPLLYTSFEWFKFPLGEVGAWGKYLAINHYQSQVRYMRRYLVSFARVNELLAPIRSHAATLFPAGVGLPQASDSIWDEVEPTVTDPKSDTLTRRVFGSTDLRFLRIATDGTTLFLRLETSQPLSDSAQYSIDIRSIYAGVDTQLADTDTTLPTPSVPGQGTGLHVTLHAGGRATVRGTPTTLHQFPVSASENALQVNVPLDLLGHPSIIFVGAESRLLGTVDRLAWTLVQLPVREHEPSPKDPASPLVKEGRLR